MEENPGMSPTKFLTLLRSSFSRPKATPSAIETGPEWYVAAKILSSAKKIAVLTGAGISAESGITTFRAKENGVWKQFDPSEVATPAAFKRNPQKVLAWHQSMRSICQNAEPNPGHHAVAKLQKDMADEAASLPPYHTSVSSLFDGSEDETQELKNK